MGVDYTGHYGVGVQIKRQEDTEDKDFIDFLDEIIEDTGFYYFEVGKGNYTDDGNEIFLSLKEPFKDGYNIQQKVNELLDFITRHKLERVGEVKEVGGLEIW